MTLFDTAIIAMGIGRIAIGLAPFVAAGASSRMLGFPVKHDNPTARLMARITRPGGTATVIHRADALATILDVLEGRFGGLRVLPIHPRSGEPAHRVLVTGRKGSHARLELFPGLLLHGAGNAFTPAIDAVLRDGAPLPWPVKDHLRDR